MWHCVTIFCSGFSERKLLYMIFTIHHLSQIIAGISPSDIKFMETGVIFCLTSDMAVRLILTRY